MAKRIVEAAGAGALESLLERFQTTLSARLDAIESQLGDIRRESLELRKEMNERFERTQGLINELGIKINTVDTRLDTSSNSSAVIRRKWMLGSNGWFALKRRRKRGPARLVERVAT